MTVSQRNQHEPLWSQVGKWHGIGIVVSEPENVLIAIDSEPAKANNPSALNLIEE